MTFFPELCLEEEVCTETLPESLELIGPTLVDLQEVEQDAKELNLTSLEYVSSLSYE